MLAIGGWGAAFITTAVDRDFMVPAFLVLGVVNVAVAVVLFLTRPPKSVPEPETNGPPISIAEPPPGSDS